MPQNRAEGVAQPSGASEEPLQCLSRVLETFDVSQIPVGFKGVDKARRDLPAFYRCCSMVALKCSSLSL
ncbi:MAG: hypothetical protein AB1801_00110 [Chloroflexota bacterium]